MRNWQAIAAAAVVGWATSATTAAEPNQTFGTATELGPTVRMTSDVLTPGFVEAPDTFLGAIDGSGFITDVNDNDDSGVSDYGNDLASVLLVVPVNFDDSINFAVTGSGDDFFFGDHDEVGAYNVIIDVYDEFGDYFETVTRSGFLDPGGDVDSFSMADFDWFGGSYDIFIDNLVGPAVGGDVDFFRFTDLTPGTLIAAEIFDPTGSAIDTTLGLFSAAGALQRSDEDGGAGLLSKLHAVVPASRELIFAITGEADDDFAGEHVVGGNYELRLSTGDFNHDGAVNAADHTTWKSALGVAGNVGGDGDFDGDSDAVDFLIWQRERGAVPTPAAAVPEPSAWGLLAIALTSHGLALTRRRNS